MNTSHTTHLVITGIVCLGFGLYADDIFMPRTPTQLIAKQSCIAQETARIRADNARRKTKIIALEAGLNSLEIGQDLALEVFERMTERTP